MDWQSLQASMPRDADLPERANNLVALTSVLEGRMYAHLEHDFTDEMSPAGEYIPFGKRRPSVPSDLCRVVVNESVAMLFSDGHFPSIHSTDTTTCEALAAFAKDRHLAQTMAHAATVGSVGSVAIQLRVLKSKPFISVLPTAYLTPTWDPEDPDTLLRVTERYKVLGRDLRAQGYVVLPDTDATSYWFQRSWV